MRRVSRRAGTTSTVVIPVIVGHGAVPGSSVQLQRCDFHLHDLMIPDDMRFDLDSLCFWRGFDEADVGRVATCRAVVLWLKIGRQEIPIIIDEFGDCVTGFVFCGAVGRSSAVEDRGDLRGDVDGCCGVGYLG